MASLNNSKIIGNIELPELQNLILLILRNRAHNLNNLLRNERNVFSIKNQIIVAITEAELLQF